MFSMDQCANKANFERAGAFDYLPPIEVQGDGVGLPVSVKTLEYCDNGDVVVRLKALGEHDIFICSGHNAPWQFRIPMVNRHNGIYEAILPASLNLHGNVVLVFIVDGNDFINPYLPTQFSGNRLVNLIEVPDADTPFTLLQDVPHGSVIREVFWSDSVKQWVRSFVYVPPGYEQGGDYPVLYLQHGACENELSWILNGKLPYIMDNVIAEGKALPFIVVANNGMHQRPGDHGKNDFAGIEGLITQDCRNWVEQKYRIRKDKWSRAIAGLSMGSMQASYIGLRHPELFGSVASFTYLRCRDRDNSFAGNPHLNVLKNPDQFAKDYRLLFRSIGSAEDHLSEFEEDDRFLEHCGIDRLPCYHRELIPGGTHDWNCWRPALYSLAQLLFR